jgi:hypothetical protein
VQAEPQPGMPFGYEVENGHAYYRRLANQPAEGERGFIALAMLKRLDALGMIELSETRFFVTDRGELIGQRELSNRQ